MSILEPRQWREAMARHGALDKDKIDPTLRRDMRALALSKLPWPLLIVGEAGSGKTCASLLYCEHWNIASEVDGRPGYQVFATCRDLCQRIADAKCDRLQNWIRYSVSLDEVWKEWAGARLAILDDIGSREKVTDSQYETVLDCLDKRQSRPTVYTSNLGRTELAGIYDDRVVSRLSAGTICHIKGDKRQHEQLDSPKIPTASARPVR